MELNDVLRRVVGQHWRLLTGCVLAGMALGLLFAPGGKEYAASSRLVLDTPDPVARQQSEAYADTAKAIATSPSKVGRALHQAGVDRVDPAAYASNHVSVHALGSSGVIEITVSDSNREVAASVANALAVSLIRTRQRVTSGAAERISTDLEQQIADYSRKIAAIDNKVSALDVQIAAAGEPAASNLRAQRDAAEGTREFLVQQRAVAQSESVSLLSANAQHPEPAIISRATPPAAPQSSHGIMYLVLGGLLGLILGMGVAGVIETVRPTLVGGDTLADELNAALLGTLGPETAGATATDVSARLQLAAEAEGVRNVALVAAGPEVDLEGLAKSLKASSPVQPQLANAKGNGHRKGHAHHPGVLSIASFDAEHPPFNNGSRSGLVLVSPPAVKKDELSDVEHLLQASRLPLLGVITYPQDRARRGLKSTIEELARRAAK